MNSFNEIVIPILDERTEVTGGAKRWRVLDRHGKQIHVGDKLRAQVCIGPYGQTRIIEVTITKAHWTYCQSEDYGLDSLGHPHAVAASFDHAANVLRCYHRHVDFEHGHEIWAEIVEDTEAHNDTL